MPGLIGWAFAALGAAFLLLGAFGLTDDHRTRWVPVSNLVLGSVWLLLGVAQITWRRYAIAETAHTDA